MNLKKLLPDISLMLFGLAIVVLGVLAFNSAAKKTININENSPKRNGGNVVSEFINDQENSVNSGGEVLGVLQQNTNFGSYGINMIDDSFTQEYPIMVPDGSGGVYVAWNDRRSGSSQAYIQRVNSSGVKQFTANGVLVGTGIFKALVIDSGGNPIVLFGNSLQKLNSSGVAQWTTQVNTGTQTTIVNYGDAFIDGSNNVYITNISSTHVYVNKVNSSGTPQWGGTNGLQISSVTTNGYPKLVTDGSGGVIVSWLRFSTPREIVAQRVTSAGSANWTAGGIVLDPSTGNDEHNGMITDGSGGAVIVYHNITAAKVRVQRLNSAGAKQWGTNGISIQDLSVGSVFRPTILSDGSGGYIVHHHKLSRIDANGTELWESIYAPGGTYGDVILTNRGTLVTVHQGNGDPSFVEVRLSDGVRTTFSSLLVNPTNGSVGGYSQELVESDGELFLAYTLSYFGDAVFVTQVDIQYSLLNVSQSDVDVLLSDNTTNIDGQFGTSGAISNNETIRVRKNGAYVLETTIDLTIDRNWLNVDFFQHTAIKRTVVSGWSNAQGVPATFSMLIVKEPGDTGVWICPNATTLIDTNLSCPGGYGVNDGQAGLSTVNISGQDYWKVDGLSGTGGLSLPQPDFLEFYTVSPYFDKLYTVDFTTGFVLEELTLSEPGTDPNYTGLGWHPVTCELYGVYRDNFAPPYSLVKINPTSGVVTTIGTIGYDIAGIAFDDNGNLYGVTGSADGSSPESLISINTTTGAGSVVLSFGTGDSGETISFNPNDGLLYHFSGAPDSAEDELFEKIDLNNLNRTPITVTGPAYGAPTSLYFVQSLDRFIFTDWNGDAYYMDTDGTATFINASDVYKGTVETVCPYSIARTSRVVLRDNENAGAVTDVEVWFNTIYDITADSIINISYLTDFTGGAALVNADITVTCDPDGADPLSGTTMAGVSIVDTQNGYLQLDTGVSSCNDFVVVDIHGGGGNSMTNPSTPGNYGWSIAYDSGGEGTLDGQGATLAYVQSENDVNVTSYVPPVLDMELYQTGVDQLLNGTGANTCSLGVLSINTVSTCTYDIGTGTNNLAGVTITITSDGTLNDGSGNEIDACSGTNCNGLGSAGVNAGEEEYGIYISELGGGEYTASNSYGTQHQAVPTVETIFATTSTTGSGTTTGSIVQRLEVTHAASMSSATNQGGYNQVVTFKAYTN